MEPKEQLPPNVISLPQGAPAGDGKYTGSDGNEYEVVFTSDMAVGKYT